MPSPDPTSAPCCGCDTRHWALGVSGGNVLYWLLATGLAGWAWSALGTKEEAIAAEHSAESITLFDAPKLVAITLAAFFALLAVFSIVLVCLLVSSNKATQAKHLRWCWISTLVFAIFILAWCVAGLILSSGSDRRGEIEEACKSIDTGCYPEYIRILVASAIVEVLGFLFLAWLLVAVRKFRTLLESGGALHDGADDEAKLLNKDGGLATTTPNSLGRDGRHRSSRGSRKRSRRSDYSDSYSMSKSHHRSSYDDFPRGRSHSRSGVRSASRGRSTSAHSMRAYERAAEEDAEWAARSMGHGRSRSRSRTRARSASRSKSRRGSFSSDSDDGGGRRGGGGGGRYRSMGKGGRRGSRSRSRSRAYDDSDSSDDGGRGRGRGRSRSRSRSRR